MNTDIYMTMESWRINVGGGATSPSPRGSDTGGGGDHLLPYSGPLWFCSDCETGPSVSASLWGKRLFWEMSYCPIRSISPRALVSGGGLGGRNPTHHSLSHPNLEMCWLIFLHDVLVLLAGLFSSSFPCHGSEVTSFSSS